MSSSEEVAIERMKISTNDTDALNLLDVSSYLIKMSQMLTAQVLLFQAKVNDLFKYRDHYFENHSIDDAINRNTDVENELAVVLRLFEERESKYTLKLFYVTLTF